MRTCLLALTAVLLVAGRVPGQDTVYRWTDEKGTVHFADVPAPHVNHFTTEALPEVPPARAAAADTAPDAAAGGVTPAADESLKGQAHVVLKDKQALAVGPSAQAFRGTVKNEGSAEARDVYVALVVTEPVQGAECLRNEIDVEPSMLGPGQEGSFGAEFDNPCFHGPTDADLRVEWR